MRSVQCVHILLIGGIFGWFLVVGHPSSTTLLEHLTPPRRLCRAWPRARRRCYPGSPRAVIRYACKLVVQKDLKLVQTLNLREQGKVHHQRDCNYNRPLVLQPSTSTQTHKDNQNTNLFFWFLKKLRDGKKKNQPTNKKRKRR